MQRKSSMVIAAGLLVAAAGAGMVLAYAAHVRQGSGDGARVTAYAASSDISAGTKGVDVAKSVKKVQMPKALVPPSAVLMPDELGARVAVRPISAGEVITSTQFGAMSSAQSQTALLQVPPGRNAVTVNVPLPMGVARYVQAGDLVNVFATFTEGRVPNQPAVTKLLLSNVQVLSTTTPGTDGSRVGPPSTGEVLMTLSLTPADAEKVIFAKSTGQLWFGLVNPGDGAASTSGQNGATVIR